MSLPEFKVERGIGNTIHEKVQLVFPRSEVLDVVPEQTMVFVIIIVIKAIHEGVRKALTVNRKWQVSLWMNHRFVRPKKLKVC